jgi:hypothetical protein
MCDAEAAATNYYGYGDVFCSPLCEQKYSDLLSEEEEEQELEQQYYFQDPWDESD